MKIFPVNTAILSHFYQSFAKSVLFFPWYANSFYSNAAIYAIKSLVSSRGILLLFVINQEMVRKPAFWSCHNHITVYFSGVFSAMWITVQAFWVFVLFVKVKWPRSLLCITLCVAKYYCCVVCVKLENWIKVSYETPAEKECLFNHHAWFQTTNYWSQAAFRQQGHD